VLAKAFGPNSIALIEEQLSFTEAVDRAVQLLELDGRITPSYRVEVLESLAKLGPYFVVAPGIALAHAAPSASVAEIGFSLLRLDHGVISGSNNDPVRLLFAFCTPTPDDHIELLGEFANFISEPGKVNLLLNASAESVIRSLL
jgi:mannitol/fructose-specific phosphotransferase system IIA component (Ntr-type)